MGKMKKVVLEEEVKLVCPNCFEEVKQCEKCCDELCKEVGMKFDCYCRTLEHFCISCGEELEGSSHKN